MNSITPVSSLAKTALDLVEDVSDKISHESELVAELQDVKDAVDTVARRSDGLMDFVASYRQLTRLPEPKKTQFLIADLFADVCRMATTQWPADGPVLDTSIDPSELDLHVDRRMIEQVLINLVQNAYHAVDMTSEPRIELHARLNQRGHVTIEVLDNGPGISADIATKIFVPFYTTRKEGSGVGLALSRQIMIANGGTITFTNRVEGGARFALVF
jgi:C4-dicarboxylate-specific signal transduction histidine kinase